VAVCLDDNSRGLTRALDLSEKLRHHEIAIHVRMEDDAGLASWLTCEGACRGWAGRISAFGQIDRASARDVLLSDHHDRIARRVHEYYLASARQSTHKAPDDAALQDWAQLPESYKEANRHVADHVDVKLRAVGMPAGLPPARAFTSDEVEIMSRMEHSRWMAERLLAGWEYAPPPKDERRKTNPNLVAWDLLDEENKEKDRMAVRKMPLWLAPPAPNG
jgi:hypothetical protein